MLIEEGYDIEIFDESLVGFEQFQIMNYYLYYLCENYESDIIIPLDSDEFLMSDTENVREILETLSLDTVYSVNWRTFVMDKRDDALDDFVCRRMKYSFIHKDHKVIIPTKLVKEYELILAAGQHYVSGAGEIKCVNAEMLKLAHYPNRSMKQFYAKSLCHSIRYINYLNRRNQEGIHRNVFANQCMEHLEDGDNNWFYEMIYERNEGARAEEITYHPVNLQKMGLQDTEMKYTKLAEVDVFKNVYALSQVMAIKAYNLEVEKNFVKGKPTILIYGTGVTAINMFKGYPVDLVNVRAYINSNKDIEFSMFERRLIITTRMLKFINLRKFL